MKDNPLFYLFAKTWQYSGDNRKNVVIYWVMFIVAESIDLFLLPLLWAKVIEIIVQEGINQQSLKTLSFLISLTLVRCVVVWSLHGPARVMEEMNGFWVRVNYRRYLTKGFLTLPIEWHVEHHSGDTIDKISKGTNALYDFSSSSFQIIYAFVRLLACFVMLSYIGWEYSIVAILVILVSAIITMRFDRVIVPNYRQINKTENQISESITDSITNISTVIILRVEKLVFDAIMRKVESPYELTRKTTVLNEMKWFCTSFCASSMRVIALLVFFLKNYGAGPGVLASTAYLLLNYLNEMGDLFFRFCGMYGDIIKRKTRVMNSEELASDFVEENFSNHLLPVDWKSLQVSNLSFTYPGVGTEIPHLDDVSLSISRGENIAFVGQRGSGKSTFMRLMRGLYVPHSLKLSVDESLIPNGFEGIHNAITLVQQDPELFAQTIEKNITMGADDPPEVIRRFTDMACFSEVVDGLPERSDLSDKLQYSIREKGINLSGGQKQCLALARGLSACRDKDIVLLDEPTSSLDAVTSVTVFQNILREFRDKTIIATIHQLDLLPMFDRICVFDKGKVVGVGTMDELRVKCPQFLSLMEAMEKSSLDNIPETSNV